MIREVGVHKLYERWKEQDMGGPQLMFLQQACWEQLVTWVNVYGQ
ncbi:TPA: hypothetical protein ACGO9B_001112 [Streptococcus suis]